MRPLIFRSRDIALIWTGQALSQAGTRMYQIGLAWWIASQGGENAGRDLGLFMAACALPSILFSKAIGRLIDSSPPKRLLVGADLACFAAVFSLGLIFYFSSPGLAVLLCAGFAVSAFTAVFDPTLNAALPKAVSSEDMEAAVALSASTQSLASFGGAALGALLIDRIGVNGTIWLNAASFLVSAACCAGLSLPFAPKHPASPEGETETGWQLLARFPFVKRVLIGFGLTNFFLTPVLIILPLYVQGVLKGSGSSLGLLEACVWFGILSGTAAARFVPWKNTAALGSLCLAVMGLSLCVPGFAASLEVYSAALILAGAALGVNNVKFLALFQERIPADSKGRFFASMQALLGFSYPAAYLCFGLLGDLLDPRTLCLIQGAGILGLSAWFLILSRESSTL